RPRCPLRGRRTAAGLGRRRGLRDLLDHRHAARAARGGRGRAPHPDGGPGATRVPVRERPRRGRAQPNPRVAVRRSYPAHRLTRTEENKMSHSPESPSDLSRRTLLRRAAAAGLLAVPATGLLGACATGGGGDSNTGSGGPKTAANPLGVKEDAALEVVIFEGGYG